MKEKLFKLLFPMKFIEIEDQKRIIKNQNAIRWNLERSQKVDFLAPIDFANVDEEAKPPHPLEGLNDTARKNALARLEAIFTDDWYIKMRDYSINVLGNHSFQVEPDETKMHRGRYAVIGVRTLNKELEKAHNEFIDSRKKPDDSFDDLAILPE